MENNKTSKRKTKRSEEQKKTSFLARIFKKNPFAFILLILIIAGTLFVYIKHTQIQNLHKEEKQTLIKQHKVEVDSLKLSSIENTIRVFSWAVRSELIRDNLEQVGQFFLWLVKEPNIQTISLIDVNNGNVILSSDKKLEQQPANSALSWQSETIQTDAINGNIWMTVPVFGLDKKIASLAIQINQ